MDAARARVISVELSDEEWKAFVQAQPEPVHWLRERIREAVEQTSQGDRANPARH